MQPQKTRIGPYEVVVTSEYLTYRLGSGAALFQTVFITLLALVGIMLLWQGDLVSKTWRPWATLFLVLVVALGLKDFYSRQLLKVFDLRTGYFGAKGRVRFALKEIGSIHLSYDDSYEGETWRVKLMPYDDSKPLLDLGFVDEGEATAFASQLSPFLNKPLVSQKTIES